MKVDRDTEIALCVFREANDALIVFDPEDRRIVDLNPAALRLTGLERKTAFSMKIADLLSSPDPTMFRQLLEACQRTGFFHSQEGYELARQAGPPIPVNVSVSRIHTRPHPLALAMIRDVSARRQVENELRRARDELESRVRERTAELLQAKEAAEAAGRVKDRFLAVLSHELRTPLTPVLAVVSALLDEPSTATELRPILEMIRRSVAQEARLIDDLLDLTRFEQRQHKLDLETVDAHDLIARTVDLCRGDAEAAGVHLVLDLSATGHSVEADPTRIDNVAFHLIQNALKFTEAGGTVVVRTTDLDGHRLGVSVSDDGRGIEPEALTTIFEPFDQGAAATRQRHGGLGLGLAISRSIIEAHGGTLTASSAGTGQGATFTFDLLQRRAAEASEAGGSPPAEPRPPLPGLDLLLVEDNKDVLRYLKLALEMRGHQVTTAADLTSARATLGRRFDLVISDIELPDGSGLELMRDLRGTMPGLAISGFGADDDIRLSLDAGFARHLTKPVDIRRLEASIREVMAEFAKGSATPPGRP